RCPPLVTRVADFVIMGGSAARGNTTPAAEFNIWCDPEAAAIVFGAGWRVTMAGLDVTRQAPATAQIEDRMHGLGPLADELLLPGLRGYGGIASAAGRPVHDVCALALIAAPGLFGCEPARVEVETQGRWTAGMTVTDFAAPPSGHNALVAMSVEVAGFWELVLGAWQRISAAMAGGGSPFPAVTDRPEGRRRRPSGPAADPGRRVSTDRARRVSGGRPRRARRRRGC